MSKENPTKRRRSFRVIFKIIRFVVAGVTIFLILPHKLIAVEKLSSRV